MLTGNIKAQDISTSKSTKTSETSKKSNKTSFEDFMSSSSKDNKQLKTDATKTKESISEPLNKSLPQKNEEVSEKIKNLAKTLLEPQKEVIANVEDDLSIIESITSLMAVLQTTIAQTLDVSEDTMKQAMEDLGFESTDLLNVENLKELVLFLNNSQNVTDLLTDENLGTSLQDLIQIVNQFKEDNSLTDDKLLDYEQQNQTVNLPTQEIIQAKNKESIDLEAKVIVIKEEAENIQTENKNEGSSKDNPTENSQEDTQNLSPTQTFVQNLLAKPLGEVGFTEQIANVRQMQEITDQIVEKIKITINPSQTSMELQLNPENLGRVNLSVVYKDGIMTAHFTAQNEAVKEALESQLQTLKDNFNTQGLKVEAVEVTVSSFAFEDQTSNNTGNEPNQSERRNRPFKEIDDFVTNEENEDLSPSILDETTSSVDFIA